MVLRREFNAAIIGALALTFADKSHADQGDDLAKVIDDYISANEELFVAKEGRGGTLLPPNHPDVIYAAKYLESLPKDLSPMELAKHIRATNKWGEKLEWEPGKSKPANPIVVAFFAATGTKPEGDITPWCTAFMTWVLQRCGYPSTKSAASRSYRDFNKFPVVFGDKDHKAAGNLKPEMGDIAVFRDIGDDSHGHITFFDGWVQGKENVSFFGFGGNQSNRLNRQVWDVHSPSKELVAIRRPVK